jgi:signal transduction histidine kinase
MRNIKTRIVSSVVVRTQLILTVTIFSLIPLFFLLLSTFVSVSHASSAKVNLSAVEKQWLKEHPVIRLAPDPNFAPIEWFTSEGQFKGISADYVALIEQKLGIKFQVVHADNWSTVMDMARNRQVDLLAAAATSPQREKFFLFTTPHINMAGVIISAKDFSSIEELTGRKVAVVVDYIWDDLLTYHKTDLRLVRVEDTLTGLELTSLGAVDAMVSDLATVTHTIREEGFTNLSIVSRLDRNLELSYAVRNDWPELHSILNKVVASLTVDEKEAIIASWIKLDKVDLWDNPAFRYSILGGLLIIVVTFAGGITWNRMLNHQVKKRTQELKDAQMQLIQAEKLKSIGRLAAGVAHEVKNPLAIIQMGSDFLSQELKENEVAGGVIKDIDDAVHRANTVILGLLDFSRDEKLNRKPLSINKVVENSLHMVSHEMHQRSIEVKTSLANNLADIELDENKLQQVFINLFMNSAHAMHQNGEITVSTRLKTLTTQSDLVRDREHQFKIGETVLAVEVTDTGPGINDEDRDKIFDPFYTTKPVGEGTGLGLSVTRNIINLHDGSIDICNRDDGGASVLMMFKQYN